MYRLGGKEKSRNTDHTVILDQILNQLYSSLFIGNLFAKLQWAARRSTPTAIPRLTVILVNCDSLNVLSHFSLLFSAAYK